MVTPPVRGPVGSAGLPIQHRRTGAQSNSRSPLAPRLRFWSAFPARMLAWLLERRAADAARRRAQRATQRAAELQAATAQLRAVERALAEGEEDEAEIATHRLLAEAARDALAAAKRRSRRLEEREANTREGRSLR